MSGGGNSPLIERFFAAAAAVVVGLRMSEQVFRVARLSHVLQQLQAVRNRRRSARAQIRWQLRRRARSWTARERRPHPRHALDAHEPLANRDRSASTLCRRGRARGGREERAAFAINNEKNSAALLLAFIRSRLIGELHDAQFCKLDS